MNDEQELLALGSIVLLKEGTQKLMVIARGVSYEDDGSDHFMDYMGCRYPEGIDPDQTIFFNHKDIDDILFAGFADEDEERFKVAYQEWMQSREVEEDTISSVNKGLEGNLF
ncbi:DUF4176 domain-containing protein [Bombilactobacillus thymidiniphilus]|uniref:DUF4176 domain-containing protein n=1 Tax=Bombilactobacillus thymidiniphilus TaxID=2923363 RepID=A0ABY4PF20_9LACO|nr:DUF4176 domain-containing protein [Bombilactobacillus thymidiniphilus]UQS84299.1 DUF4176 domain-containing protein [Bombilactobacillus thymidiniphilus]